MIKLLYKIVVLFLFISFACTKNVAGPQGDPGEPAKKGNLKQSHSVWVQRDTTDWYLNSKGYWESLIFMEQLNSEIIKNSEVKVYAQKDSVWLPLPFIEKEHFAQFSIGSGIVRLSQYRGHSPPGNRPIKRNYRIVILSP